MIDIAAIKELFSAICPFCYFLVERICFVFIFPNRISLHRFFTRLESFHVPLFIENVNVFLFYCNQHQMKLLRARLVIKRTKAIKPSSLEVPCYDEIKVSNQIEVINKCV